VSERLAHTNAAIAEKKYQNQPKRSLMKVEPKQAVNAVIAFKKRQRIQTQKEDKIMFDQIKNRKAIEKKKEEMIMKANGLKKKDLKGIRKETRKIFKQSLETFAKIKRPEKEPALQVLSRWAEQYGHSRPDHHHPKDTTHQHVSLTSATGCDGNLCDSQNATIFPIFESDGVGGHFGNEATTPSLDQSNSLFYTFEPLVPGLATIIAELRLTGRVSAFTSAEVIVANWLLPFLWGSRCTADVTFGLRMNVWQGTTLNGTIYQPVANLHCENGDHKFQAFQNDLYLLILTTPVTQNEMIVIELMAEANVTGRSWLGVAIVDFGNRNLNFGIRVPQVDVFVNPPY
jgi:hypothetical protein